MILLSHALTEADLIEIGVKSVGHRRKLVDAIAALPQQDAAAPYAIGGRPSEAEQRQVRAARAAVQAQERVPPRSLTLPHDPMGGAEGDARGQSIVQVSPACRSCARSPSPCSARARSSCSSIRRS